MSDQMMQGKSIRHSCFLTDDEKALVEYFRQLDAYGRAKVITAMMNQVDRLAGRYDYGRYVGKAIPVSGKIVEFEVMRFPNGRRTSK